jgi:hypothetical protein
VAALAEVEHTAATDLDYVLADYVEVDAVRQLMAGGTGDWSLDFEVPDHRVTVGSDGWILVDGERVRRWTAQTGGSGGSEAPVT